MARPSEGLTLATPRIERRFGSRVIRITPSVIKPEFIADDWVFNTALEMPSRWISRGISDPSSAQLYRHTINDYYR
jgi:hypothetical protein